jgi:centractin
MDSDNLFKNNDPLIIDNGSAIIKAGIGGKEKPELEFNAYVGRPKHTKVMMTPSD